MRIILEDKTGYGRGLKRVERADKRDIRKARRAKAYQRLLDTGYSYGG